MTKLTVQPSNKELMAGQTQQFSATAKDANGNTLTGIAFTWSSDNIAVATVNASGLASGVSAGTVHITATVPNGVSGSATLIVQASAVASVTISPSTAQVSGNQTQQFSATAKDANGNPITSIAFTWSSDNISVATVNASGLASGVSAGTAHISATAPNGVSGSATLIVQAPVAVSVSILPASAQISSGQSQQFSATAKDANGNPITSVAFTWSSDNISVATVNASGLASGVSAGTAHISATAPNGVSGSATLIVQPQLANDCTIYASPSGNGDGRSYASPTSLRGANTASTAGSVICLEGGTYDLPATLFLAHSGTSSAHVVWKAYGDSAVKIRWTGGTEGSYHTMFNLYGKWASGSYGPSYIDFNGNKMWSFDGQSYASAAFSINGSHHVTITGMYIANMTAAGISTVNTDYIKLDQNVAYKIGENPQSIPERTTVGTEAAASATYSSGTVTATFSGSFNATRLFTGLALYAASCSQSAYNNSRWIISSFNALTIVATESGSSAPASATGCTLTVGYQVGWGSAYSINSAENFDGYAGIHNYIINNIAVGVYDSSHYHTDGNGIILDLSNNGTWPPTLILNNLVYGNGGRCINLNNAGQTNALVFNNSCYLNGLDSASMFPEILIAANGAYVANNIAVGLGSDGCTPMSGTCEADYYEIGNPGPTLAQDLYFGGFGNNFSNPNLLHVNPAFVNPPSLASGGYDSVADPGIGGANVGNAFQLASASGAKRVGVDPSTLPGLNSNIQADLRHYVYLDINGTSRRVSGGYSGDLGAYQSAPTAASIVRKHFVATGPSDRSRQFVATALDYRRHFVRGVRSTWSSDVKSAAKVKPSGIALALNAGTVQISATAPSGAPGFVPASSFVISGSLLPAATARGATITLNGSKTSVTKTDQLGKFNFSGLSPGSYVVSASKTGFSIFPSRQTVTLNNANVSSLNLTARKISGPIVIEGENGSVVEGRVITSTTGDCLQIINSTNITIQNSEIGPCAGNGITIIGGSTISVLDSYIHPETQSPRCCDHNDGILDKGGTLNLWIQGNVIAYGESNISVQRATNVTVRGNFLLNPRGQRQGFARHGGNHFQCWNNCANVSVINNYVLSGVDLKRYLYPAATADSLSFRQVDGFAVENNFIVGEHRIAGCAIMAGTYSSNGQIISNNILDTGRCGIGVKDGSHVVSGNKVYNTNAVESYLGGSAAVYVAHFGESNSCGPMIVANNIADEVNSDGSHSGWWNGGNCGTIETSTNIFGESADSLLTPVSSLFVPPMIPPEPKSCVVTSPYSTQTTSSPCGP